MNEHLPIYNSRVIKNYVEYLRAYYPHVNPERLLRSAGMSRQEVEDPAHWFSQNQIDRFHSVLSEETHNPGVSREAGRFAAFSKASGPLKRYAMGFMSPLSAYRLLEKITPHLTRGGTFKTVKLGSNKIEVYHIPKPGVVENPNQCENRMGQLEAISKIFTDKFAKIAHPACVHHGDELCRYIITWHETPAHRWKTFRNLALLGGAAASLSLWWILPLWPWLTATSAFTGICLFAAYRSEREEKKQMAKSIAFQGDTTGVYLEEMQSRYNRALLMQELGQASSSASDARRFVEDIIPVLERGLDFERGMILLADQGKGRLLYAAGFGLTEGQENRLRESGLSLDEPGHAFVRAFKQREPVLEQGPEEELKANGVNDGSDIVWHALLCVPLFRDGECVGVFAAGNRSAVRTIAQSDVNFLVGIASEIGLSLSKVSAFQKLQESEAKLKRAQKMEALGTLAGGVAHDLNNILPSLISYPDLILMELPADSPLRKPILGIKQSGEKASALAQDLLTLARRGVSTAVSVDINRTISEYLDSPEFERIKAERPRLRVTTTLAESPPKVLGSPIQLYKIVMNIVLNAAEAVPEDGRVLISTQERLLEKSLRGFEDVPAGRYAVIRVADSGIGIAPEDLEKIFEPFFTKKKMGRSGSGLGMAVVWGAVKDHNGYIDVRSTVGKGTTFTIFLPATEEEKPGS